MENPSSGMAAAARVAAGRKGKVGRGQAFSSIGRGPSRAAGLFPVGGRSTSVGSLLPFGRGSSRAAGLVPFGRGSNPAAPLSSNGEAASSSSMAASGAAESPLSAASLATAVVASPERLRRHLLDSRSLHLHLRLGGARIPLVQGVPQFGNQMQHAQENRESKKLEMEGKRLEMEGKKLEMEGKKLEKESKMMDAYNNLISQDTSSMTDDEKVERVAAMKCLRKMLFREII